MKDLQESVKLQNTFSFDQFLNYNIGNEIVKNAHFS